MGARPPVTCFLNASRVIITTRSEAKGNAAIASLRADPEVQCNNPHARLELFHLDQATMSLGYTLLKESKGKFLNLTSCVEWRGQLDALQDEQVAMSRLCKVEIHLVHPKRLLTEVKSFATRISSWLSAFSHY